MATQIYQPPQEFGATVVYGIDIETGSTLYEDPDDVLFAGDLQLVGTVPTVAVA